MKAKVAERGQVTIPKPLRDRMGVRPGTILDFREEDGKLIAEKAGPLDAVDKAYGLLGAHRRTDNVMRDLRGEL